MQSLRLSPISLPPRRTPPVQLLKFPRPSVGLRPYSSPSPSTPPKETRLLRLLNHTPTFLQPWVRPILTAPLSHVTSFLILHELTAVVPLVGLTATFHYTQWLPSWFAEGEFVLKATGRIGKYARKKGWITEGEESQAEHYVEQGEDVEEREQKQRGTARQRVKKLFGRAEEENGAENEKKKSSMWQKGWRGFARGEDAVRLVVEAGTAYAIVKALLPLRIIMSAWMTPWFARWTVVPLGRWGTRALGLGKKVGKDGAGKTKG
ncbi:MAG: hypothetical protein Q9227_001384 [Pyrenula ochraceoflavens]